MINKKKLVGVILAGVLTVTSATAAYAADQPSGSGKAFRGHQRNKVDSTQMSATFKSVVDSMVKAGTINQSQADAIVKNCTPGVGMRNPMNELVTAGTITQIQADAVNTALKTARSSQKTAEEVLKELVSVKTITEVQKEAVLKILPKRDLANRPLFINKSQLDNLVATGVLTQAQADAVAKLDLPGNRNGNANIGKGNPPQGARGNVLGKLVTEETITQAQADEFNKALKAAIDSLEKK